MTQDEIKLLPHNMINGIAVLLTETEIAELTYVSEKEQVNVLNNTKTSKLLELKANKEASLNSFVLISINGFDFNVYKSQLEVLAARIYYLETNNLTSSNWTDNDNFRRELTLDQFRDLYSRARNHYTVLDDNTYTLYTDLKNEIKACESVEELNNININFS
jgi:hypothetical protein|tara:strand:+ start:2767 stop:3252 length:486 start_codon:yes stop_codon:yes gene_type:complete